MNSITLNGHKALGKIKPMHATNNIPAYSNAKLQDLFKQVVPYTRFHDTFIAAYDRFIDISNVFPNFDADETDPASYDFAFTDSLMKKMSDMGVKCFYRLGVSIENYHDVKTYNIYPPKDFNKWARICEHVIAHYNEGWADGMNMGIEYWEIWNEPDNFPDICDNQMWKGTFEQYLELYKIASNHLKNRFPNIKVGGYASCGFYAILEEKSAETAKVSSRTDYFIDCFIKFLKYISSEENKSPLDFFSWHSYSGVQSNIKYAQFARKTLDEYGFTKTESILNEWNPGIGLRGTLQDASNVLTNMIELHRVGMDMLMYYDARVTSNYGGMFSPLGDAPRAHEGKALPTYYAFYAFNELYKRGNWVEATVCGENIHALAASGQDTAVVITNDSDQEKPVELIGFNQIKEAKTITFNGLEDIKINGFKHTLKPFEVIVLYI